MLFSERKILLCGWSAIIGVHGNITTQGVITPCSFWAQQNLGEEFPPFSPLSK